MIIIEYTMSSLDNATANALSNSIVRLYKQLSVYTMTTVATIKNNSYVAHVYKNLTISCKLGLATMYSFIHTVAPFWCEMNPYLQAVVEDNMKEDKKEDKKEDNKKKV